MGKEEGGGQQQQQQPSAAAAEGGGSGGGGGGGGWCSSWCRRAVRPQCVAALLLGVAVVLSALFWLPPFAGHRGRAGPPDPGGAFAADIVASFVLQKTVPELNETKSKLEFDIYEEIGIPNTTSTMYLTESLFGSSSFFEVIKFPGGITIIPPQAAFLLQKPYASFNFTLNFPIYKVQDKTNELKDQMKIGLRLNPYENLYIKLTNSQGSTVAAPTIVQASVVLEVGNHQPSPPRMKQLAQTIANSSSGNLGLNNTVFGRVKQISLSSYLSHSLHSGGGTNAPSPAPMPHQDDQHRSRRRHHHHHHSHDEKKHFAPSPVPVHSPVQQPKYRSPSPSCYPYRYTNKPKNKAPVAPASEPVASSHHRASPATIPHAVPPSSTSPSPSVRHSPNNPKGYHSSPAPSPALAKHHLRALSLAHAHHPAKTPAMTPAPHSSYATRRHSSEWTLALLMCMLMGLP
ncbi:hypothetical protein EJB05_35262 [Eragrostis curvula]|uniref:DUF7036 domain-containing protein n=1 Tax=Eragrostis curvula TaxID=38414 RepID=A0A5J9U793_9POAL|nr:hypothetical protein EJB05_35262 [Eragrostis curvula]